MGEVEGVDVISRLSRLSFAYREILLRKYDSRAEIRRGTVRDGVGEGRADGRGEAWRGTRREVFSSKPNHRRDGSQLKVRNLFRGAKTFCQYG